MNESVKFPIRHMFESILVEFQYWIRLRAQTLRSSVWGCVSLQVFYLPTCLWKPVSCFLCLRPVNCCNCTTIIFTSTIHEPYLQYCNTFSYKVSIYVDKSMSYVDIELRDIKHDSSIMHISQVWWSIWEKVEIIPSPNKVHGLRSRANVVFYVIISRNINEAHYRMPMVLPDSH